ncbi:alpha/beta hydrolase [Gordonia sp. PP30]|uniref:alpha/beta hydrolase fold domain-containing protein n=1 Tax=Gordonia sp. PP30 TaxID=2935861 RepID=UPI001FFEAFDD|nr:alpha/beta hydrolase fold domain-containing protein [Gordonia sp. PP30]UQE76603.1 alpha/beta hydrolase [Gordonia sp. PP30]
MVEQAYQRTMAGTDPRDRLVIGDSAGGTLALLLTRHLREQNLGQPAGIALLSPWIDLATDDSLSREIDPVDPELGVDGLRQAGRWFAGQRALDDPVVSPAFGDLGGSPPVTVFIGDRDILLPDARRIKSLGDAAGVEVDLHEYPGMFHNWIMQPIPEGRRAVGQLLDFIATTERKIP